MRHKLKKWRKTDKRAIRFRGRLLNVSAFSKKHGLDGSYVWRLLHGHRTPESMSLHYALKLAGAFGCSVEELVAQIKEMQAAKLVEEPSDL